MMPTPANGQPAAATYYRDSEPIYNALRAAVLTATPGGITVFGGGAGLVARFGVPPVHAAVSRPR
jgi:RNA polymerase sigma-70 factor (ECF subfamily)